jgi:metallo-beta-lactamase class B
MRFLFAGLLAVLTFIGGAQAQTLRTLLKDTLENWNKPTEPFKIIGNIYYVGTNGLASYLVTSPQGHFLIDAAMPETATQIEDSIQKLGFKLSDVKYILNTHAHMDHTGGFAQIKKDTGAQLISGEKDKPLLEGGYYPGNDDEFVKFPPVKVDRVVQHGEKLTLGDVTITANSTPGHSPGCTSWSMTVKDGDADRSVMIFCSATVALNRLVTNPTHPGIVDDYKKTFAWSKNVHPDVLLAPHPEMYGMPAKRAKIAEGAPNPFVQPGEFNAFVDKLEKDFDTGLAKQTADAAAKK